MKPAASILLIGRKRSDDSLNEALRKTYRMSYASSGKRALALAKNRRPALFVLDAASMRTSGERICRNLKKAHPKTPIIHIHPGPEDEANSPADTVLFWPVSVRHLLNSVGGLLHHDHEEVLHCGPIRMNVPRRILVAHGKEVQLTPKQAQLMEVFLRNPGKTLDRKTLMQKVWQTDYVGDTRTLSVHIRWVRTLLQDSTQPSPEYIKTVRGVGYCFMPPEDNHVS